MAFSGTSTPQFDSFDPAFGTPMFLTDDKTDYFSTQIKPSTSEFNFSGVFSPFPQQKDITPPQTAVDPPSGWPSYNLHTEPTIEDQFQQDMPEINTTTAKIQYGQTTPPDEAQRAPSMDEFKNGFPPQTKPATLKRESTSSTKSKSPKRSKKNSKNEEVDQENDKRSKFLERNRVAASKCRQKKKEYNQGLESRAKDYERQNAVLKIMLEELQRDKINLMTQMSMHNPNECECKELHQYLANFKNTYQSPPHLHSRNGSIVASNAASPDSISTQ